MAPLTDLISCNIIEKDCNGDVLWAWIYPTVSEAQKSLITRKCGLSSENNNSQPFTFSRFNNEWFYINCCEVFDTDKLPRVKQFALVLFTKDFNPQKYEMLSRVLSKMYSKTGDPIEILKLYLSVSINGSCTTQENGIFKADHYDINPNHDTNVRDLIRAFELETILIYTGLLLKKRIFIYHHSLEQLFKWIKTFPSLMKHRNVTDYLFPWIDSIPEEINDLKGKKYYVAGCRDSSISLKPELYDLLVNIPAREITIAPHAKESFTMTKTHKEIALFMIQLSEKNSLSETQIIQEIADKTQDLLNQLNSIASTEDQDKKKVLSIKIIRERNLPTAVENFLINLAIAEDFTVI
ncbi:putative DENN domain-containing protein 10 B [Chelonus insularis]|uniref:putative DENN domain-containing protein 10 B n=1 Tax=Chelonus insularis TaxID=460826 RepID=UPI00158D23DE|nr:putative DENN domain-containing protein 10 B [Chelonus insularis]